MVSYPTNERLWNQYHTIYQYHVVRNKPSCNFYQLGTIYYVLHWNFVVGKSNPWILVLSLINDVNDTMIYHLCAILHKYGFSSFNRVWPTCWTRGMWLLHRFSILLEWLWQLDSNNINFAMIYTQGVFHWIKKCSKCCGPPRLMLRIIQFVTNSITETNNRNSSPRFLDN